MTELDANVVGAVLIVACVIYSVVMLKLASKNRFPW